jgi:hypothetical protein
MCFFPAGYIEDAGETRTKLREGARFGAPGVGGCNRAFFIILPKLATTIGYGKSVRPTV